jgi:hypothetical protein
MLTIIGRAATLTKGSNSFSIIPDSGPGVPTHQGAPRYCYFAYACRKVINDGVIALAQTELTLDNTCPGNLPVCTLAE